MQSITSLYFDIDDDQMPIVYDDKYNVSFMGLERCHPFDAKKWGNVVRILKINGMITDENIVHPLKAKEVDLQIVHTPKYLKSLKWSFKVAKIAEVPLIALLPNILVQKAYLKPMRLQTGGSILAGKLALERGWAINIGGGFHHCSSNHGGGFCPYADITLLIQCLMKSSMINSAMILDLDAHQGNGYERDFLGVSNVYIMDMYNRSIYPKDKKAKRAIRRKVELSNGIEDIEYMSKLKSNFEAALKEFSPDILVYNAGTDVLADDPLGHLDLTPVGVMQRDFYVFRTCMERHIPIVMLTSGGYLRRSANVIAQSIANLNRQGLLKMTSKEKQINNPI